MNIFKDFSYLPVSLFGSIMGLSGLSIAFSLAYKIYNIPLIFYKILSTITIIAFVVLFLSYLIKIIFHFESFKKEFINPLLKPFFGTFCIAILLLPIIISPFSVDFAFILWIIGTILMLGFSIHMINFWILQKNDLLEITPAWIIPVVGNLDIPLAMKFIELKNPFLIDISLFALSVGLFFSVPIFTLIIYRILFHSKLPDKLSPTLMILIAPFSVGFSAYSEFFGIDFFAILLFYVGLFIFLALLPSMKNLSKCCPFRITWWAVSFPISALLVATLKMAEFENKIYFDVLAMLFLVLFSMVIMWLFIRTILGIIKGELKNLV